MKISEFIQQLQDVYDEEGDMEIAIKIDDNDLGSEPIVVKSTVYEQLYIVNSKPPSGITFKDMTKEELKAKVAKQQSIINDANEEICSYVNDYIESLPYKVGDKISCSRCDICWITSIVPKKGYSGYTGEIEVRINPAKKDGTRSNREFVLWSMVIDSIKKID